MADIDITALTGFAADFKLFGNAAGNGVEWANGMKVIGGTRDMQGLTGDVSYTGTGFKPSGIIAIATVPDALPTCIGSILGSSYGTMYQKTAGIWYPNASALIYLFESAGKTQSAIVKTFDANGFTLTWTLAGATAVGTAYIYFACFR